MVRSKPKLASRVVLEFFGGSSDLLKIFLSVNANTSWLHNVSGAI